MVKFLQLLLTVKPLLTGTYVHFSFFFDFLFSGLILPLTISSSQAEDSPSNKGLGFPRLKAKEAYKFQGSFYFLSQWVLDSAKSAPKLCPSTSVLHATYLSKQKPNLYFLPSSLLFLILFLKIVACSCSLVCYKKHKELPCVKPQPLEVITTAVPESLVEKTLVVDERSEVLQKFQLEAIASSREIRDSLNDKALQDLICRIDSSSNAKDELDKAMAEEAFRLFTDKILSTINP